MARKKISEFRAKILLHESLGILYKGKSIGENLEDLNGFDNAERFVVKVDEGVKKRMKQGLVALDKSPQEIKEEIKKFKELGYEHFIVEPFVPHESSAEKYLSFERAREGLCVLYSHKGGIDVEENQDAIKKRIVSSAKDIKEIARELSFDESKLQKIIDTFDAQYFSFLEINPLVIAGENFYFLDIAAEVDSSGEFFVKGAWNASDFRDGSVKQKTGEEQEVEELSVKSQASFKLDVLNADGSIFMLLSGGGASIVLADEAYNLGFGKELANYGEYSGNPNADEVYIYAKNLLSLLTKSAAAKKALVIGGGVANFTDVRITFKGIIKALDEVKEKLQEQEVKVYVRRGGPHQEEGLRNMENFLKGNNLYGFVGDPTTPLPKIVNDAVLILKETN